MGLKDPRMGQLVGLLYPHMGDPEKTSAFHSAQLQQRFRVEPVDGGSLPLSLSSFAFKNKP